MRLLELWAFVAIAALPLGWVWRSWTHARARERQAEAPWSLYQHEIEMVQVLEEMDRDAVYRRRIFWFRVAVTTGQALAWPIWYPIELGLLAWHLVRWKRPARLDTFD